MQLSTGGVFFLTALEQRPLSLLALSAGTGKQVSGLFFSNVLARKNAGKTACLAERVYRTVMRRPCGVNALLVCIHFIVFFGFFLGHWIAKEAVHPDLVGNDDWHHDQGDNQHDGQCARG